MPSPSLPWGYAMGRSPYTWAGQGRPRKGFENAISTAALSTAVSAAAMSYYSIDDIETDGIKVPTKFLVDSPGLGFLLPEPDKNIPRPTAIPSGADVVLPLWLATPLASASVDENSDDAFLEMGEPVALRHDVLNVLKSEPAALDLRSQDRLFVNLALTWCELFASEELGKVLYDTVRIRAAYIFDAALAQQGADYKLDEYELSLYAAVSRMIRDLKQWYKDN